VALWVHPGLSWPQAKRGLAGTDGQEQLSPQANPLRLDVAGQYRAATCGSLVRVCLRRVPTLPESRERHAPRKQASYGSVPLGLEP